MFLNAPLDRLRRSLALRLSLWFAALFTVGFTAIFALLYWTLARQLETRDYESLQLRLQQYSDIYAASGLYGLRQRVAEDSEAPHVRSLFIRIVSTDGSSVWGKIPPDWIASDVQRIEMPFGSAERRTFSLRVPRDEERDLTIVARTLADGRLLQVGRSTDSRTVLLAPLRHTFLWVGGAVVIVGFVAGLLAAWRAMRPLHDVIAAARRIVATGALDVRVPLPRRDDEIASLVRAFNTVLDKNASLLRVMREALDNVAHDLRTPLTRLRGTAELALQAEADGGVQTDALADCVEQTDEVLKLLRALMEISEAEAGMLKLDKATADLSAIARVAAELYTEVAEAKSVGLELTLADHLPVQADAIRLRQAVANLVDNAVKYTPDGGTVFVSSRLVDGEAIVRVSDTGPGVPPADQVRMWDRLYRGDASRSQRGLGLGLSMVRAIVEAHGGHVSYRNREGGGAEFEVRLPAVAEGSPAS